ncbi:hypothetical protein E4U27_001450 [Claviceps purpurea]|nr:hypothetical protein E4U27_001450 [Claviceps purpurea]
MAEQRTIALTGPSSYSKLYARQVVGEQGFRDALATLREGNTSEYTLACYSLCARIEYRLSVAEMATLKTWCAFIQPSGRSNHYNSEYLENTETPIINIACTSKGEGRVLRQQAQLLLKVTTAGNALALA